MAGRDLLSYVVLGINGTTRALEKQAQGGAQIPNSERIVLVVVCKGDVDPQMVAHLPGLAHVAHSAGNGKGEIGQSGADGLRLIGVGKGAEQKLASAVSQHRVSVVGIKAGAPLLDGIIAKAHAKVAPPVVPWIGTAVAGMSAPAATFHPMRVHELHTTAPILDKKRDGAAAKKVAEAPPPTTSAEARSPDSKKRQRDASKNAKSAPKHSKKQQG
ncbi:RNase P and RNase MRP subunit [Coemansia aciculifera]|nr:RNase P and RNase MRP subunit [Coemansia aciculifera]